VSRTIAFLNRKGGVGKTSTVHHLGGSLARRGLRVLLVDVDGQASLSQGLLGTPQTEDLDPRETSAAIFDDAGTVSPRDLVRPTKFDGLWLIPGSEATEQYNEPRPWELGSRQYVLRDALDTIADGFDLVLIDCPPHIQLLAWSALAAADGVVVPVMPEEYGALGLKSIRRVIAQVKAQTNSRLALVGYLVSMMNKALTVHVSYEHQLRTDFGDDVFTAMVPLAKDYKMAVIERKPIVEYKPRSAATTAITTLADEFLARLDARIPGNDEPRRVA
jgi:chromosome partitioning protein